MDNVVLSIVIPCYNERENIIKILDKIVQSPVPNKEIIVVDDMSTDGTRDILEEKVKQRVSKLIYREENGGKGILFLSPERTEEILRKEGIL